MTISKKKGIINLGYFESTKYAVKLALKSSLFKFLQKELKP